MSGELSNKAAWFSLLERAEIVSDRATLVRPDDPRLGEIVEFWDGDMSALKPGRGVILGFPQDEGVRRNRGRPGAAAAPNEIRRFLYRLTPWDGSRNIDLVPNPPLDAGNVRIEGSLEDSQHALGEVVAGILRASAIPIVLGGGHETAFGHYRGYAATISRQEHVELRDETGKTIGFIPRPPVAIINIDAHLDVRPCNLEGGHSGSPFRQILEDWPLTPYVCLGVQPHAVSREHVQYVYDCGDVVCWCDQVRGNLCAMVAERLQEWRQRGRVYLSIDADVVQLADVPGVSAPNVSGLSGSEVLAAAFLAGQSAVVSSMDLVEINPSLDRDGQSSRWGALLIWHFLVGLASRAV